MSARSVARLSRPAPPSDGASQPDRHLPRATYRVQLRPEFGFRAAGALAPYLAQLGISHVYSSPILQAAPGSTHGYDVVDPGRVNAELGGEIEFGEFGRVLGRHRLGQIVDIVPNHMAIPGADNPWWWDVLENGPSSRYARYFDVDWDPPESHLRNRVLLPILGDHYGRVLEAGELQLVRDGGSFVVVYHEHRVPVAPRTLDELITRAGVRAESDDLVFIGGALGRLPPSTALDQASVDRRHRDKEVLRLQLARLASERAEVARALDAEVEATNADADRLDAILDRQNYRLAHWRAAGQDLVYRRFFDVAGLIGIRVEDPIVFADTHALVLRWLGDGVIDGLRVDHPDGLRDPAAYFRALRDAAPRAWIVGEKIVEGDEELPADWPIDGTTGYEFLNLVGGLFVDRAAEAAMTSAYEAFTGLDQTLPQIVRKTKLVVLRENLGSELNRLTALLLEICEGHRRHRDYTRHDCHEVLRELAISYPRYRTYVRTAEAEISETDALTIATAVADATAARPDLDADLFGFVGDVLSVRIRGTLESELAMRFQQLTGAVMAKGVEDTAFYRYHRLVSLNEVGGDPAHFGVTPAEFHAANLSRLNAWPNAMLTTSTHDTKRAEDVRARLHVLSEIPEAWAAAVNRWSARLARRRTADLPDRNAEYLFFQTLVGTWPIETDRLAPYLVKAARESQVRTSWASPDEDYEVALAALAEAALTDSGFRDDLEAFLRPVIEAGRINSIAQTILKLTSPGVPDLYQGTELWDLSLVDPDNRRPVDFERRAWILDQLAGATVETALDGMDEGWPKLWAIQRTLGLRSRRPEVFDGRGTYAPLRPSGLHRDRIVGFVRGGDVAVIVPRLSLGLQGRAWGDPNAWGDTSVTLPAGRWTNVLADDPVGGGTVTAGPTIEGGRTPITSLLARFPGAVLVRAAKSAAQGAAPGSPS
ncbi:MAG: malto-oligosyltrehalose synthase [Candidatus Limnocylindrales bacterium]